ncbi:heavy metal-responsive transcriptional regulator [Halothiobacillus sp.]|uniref:heavy metal-responsive transcriptional regulator n=1 Tax=Halothiobacillus sp. TaxID=1891311 RepID=UPI002AD45B50|nr:heavy metal-responsive transcriptional regulator [Halothiobacillus sp.]
MDANISIGALAQKAGVATETLRYYERLGLIAPKRRTAANYRVYDTTTTHRLTFIRQAQSLGFSLTEISELLALHGRPMADMAEVKQLTETKIADIDQKITHLQRIKSGLEAINTLCPGHGPTTECPILNALINEDK